MLVGRGSENRTLELSDKKTMYRAPLEMRKLHTAVSIALSIPSSVQKEVVSSVLMNSLRENPSVKSINQ